jgi:hypothetical protein
MPAIFSHLRRGVFWSLISGLEEGLELDGDRIFSNETER